MGTARASNKDILTAIEAMSQGIINAITAQQTPIAVAIGETKPVVEQTAPKVDPAYKAHIELKAAAHAVKQNAPVVAYARMNKAGQQKLAYALRTRYDEVISKQPSCQGPIAVFNP